MTFERPLTLSGTGFSYKFSIPWDSVTRLLGFFIAIFQSEQFSPKDLRIVTQHVVRDKDLVQVRNLFLVFINSVLLAFGFLSVLLFVDDAQGFLHTEVDSINSAIQKVNTNLQKLVRWVGSHGSGLNSSKTVAIIIESRNKLQKLSLMYLQRWTSNPVDGPC